MSKKKYVILACLKGFAVGVVAMPVWTFFISCGIAANGLDPKDFPVINGSRFWLNEIIAGFMGIGVWFLISWDRKKREKKQ